MNKHHLVYEVTTPHRKNVLTSAFQCTTRLVWNKLGVSKTLIWRRQKIRGWRGLLGRVIPVWHICQSYSPQGCSPYVERMLALVCTVLLVVIQLVDRQLSTKKEKPANRALSNCRIPCHSMTISFTCVGVLWRTRYTTTVAIPIHWDANKWKDILQLRFTFFTVAFSTNGHKYTRYRSQARWFQYCSAERSLH